MSIFQRTWVIFLLVLSVGVCYIYYILYLYQRKMFRHLSIGSNTNIIIKEAIDLSNRIHNNHANTFATQELSANSYHNAEWFKPLEAVNYGDGTCDFSEKRRQYKDLMEKWRNISDIYKIPSFLYAGSLIGAARNADSIPWDGDMDVLVDGRFCEVVAAIADERDFDRYDGGFHLVIQEDYMLPPPQEKIGLKLYYTEHRRRFDCTGKEVSTMTDNCAFQEPFGRLIQNGIHLDLWDYNFKEDVKKVKNGVDLNPHNKHNIEDIIYTSSNYRFPLDVTFPLKKCMFLDMEMLCPNQPIHFLKIIYGQDIMSPQLKCRNGRWIE